MSASLCPLCGRPNECQLCTTSAYKGPCWCMSAEIPEALLQRVPAEDRNRRCICRQCVDAFRNQPKRRSEIIESGPLRESDYYFDCNNLMVFTAIYLQRRGYCCRNGCRHCPYPAYP